MSPEEHKKIAIKCFNAIWKILDKKEPNQNDCLEAIRLAHSSTWHWYQCGEPVNFQRGEWICSRVYAHFNHLEEALYHGKICRQLTKEHDLNDFDLSYSYEALARVYKKLGNKEKFQEYYDLLEKSLKQVKGKEDLKILKGDMGDLN